MEKRVLSCIPHALCLAVGCLALVACQGHPPTAAPRLSLGSSVAGNRVRSLVFDSPRLARLSGHGEEQRQAGELPWYSYRNDARLSTPAGYQSPTFEQAANFTSDHQFSSNGRVHDFYSSTTYRSSYVQSTR